MKNRVLIVICGILFSCLVVEAQVLLGQGDDFQQIIDSHPPGATFEIQAGVHRGIEMVPREGDTIIGAEGAILSGAELLTGWRFEDPYWVHDGPHSKVVPDYDSSPLYWEVRARYPHDLFVDDVPVKQTFHTVWLSEKTPWYYDYNADKIYVNFDPSDKKMELGGLCRFGLRTKASGVTLRNIRFEKYATNHQKGAVELGQNALVEDCVVYGSHSVGLRITSGSVVRNSRFLWNGNAGLHNGADGTLIELNEFAYNGWAGFSGNWGRGGLKTPNLTNSVVRRNYAHHNTGPGIWFDINSNQSVCEENLCEFNSWEGILFEISCDCVFRRNVLRSNGLGPRGGDLWGVPFVIQNAEGGKVYENYFESAQVVGARSGGLTIVNQNRPQHTGGVCGTHIVERNHIYDNVMVMPGGGTNGLEYGTFGWNDYSDFVSANNVWENNRYISGAPHGNKFHWYVEGETPTQFINRFFGWAEWRMQGNDNGSTFESRHRSFFNPTNPELHALILEATGISYEELKAPFVDSIPFDPAIDIDADELPDGWEKLHGLEVGRNDAMDDRDQDGLNNFEEFTAKTNPNSTDTDGDGLPDGWEARNGTDPIAADSLLDEDEDSLSNLEEYESETNPLKFDPLSSGIANSTRTLWLKPGPLQVLGDGGGVRMWRDSGISENWAFLPFNQPSPKVSLDLMDGYPSLEFGPGNLQVTGDVFGDESDGWSLTMVVRPRDIDIKKASYALMGNSVWKQSGFRLVVERGYLRFYSTQGEDPLSFYSFQALEAGRASVVTLLYDGAKREGRMYINGIEQKRDSGWVPNSSARLWLGKIGGIAYQKADFAEILIYSRILNHLERRDVEAMLLAKYLNTGPALSDADGDGMGDWWELEFGPDLNDPDADPDGDGLNNLVEFENRTNPREGDSDGDGQDDFQEVAAGTNPWSRDSDGDGLADSVELDLGTSPIQSDSDGDGMSDGWEVEWDFDPLVEDSDGDRDSDGLLDRDEFVFGLRVDLADTDGDGIPDGWEVSSNLDGLVDDSAEDKDSDGVPNGEEYTLGLNANLSDTDGDGMPDGWEIEWALDPLIDDASSDLDADGVTNRQEFALGLRVDMSDTDGDEMIDGWEVDNGLDPLVDDGFADGDADGFSNLEEMELDTDPHSVDPLPVAIEREALSLWLRPGASVDAVLGGDVTAWNNVSESGDSALPIADDPPASISPDSVNGYEVIRFGEGILETTQDLFGEDTEGFTIVMGIRVPNMPGEGEFALFGNGGSEQNGFGAKLVDGFPTFFSYQPGMQFSVASREPIIAGDATILSLTYHGTGKEIALDVNGEADVRVAGEISIVQSGLTIGRIEGLESQDFDLCEILVFSEALGHRQRTAVESMLMARYQGSGPGTRDGDGDGFSDWWELEFGPGIENGEDADEDGLDTLAEFELGTDPNSMDSDGDGASDSTELVIGGDPWRNERVRDEDTDGLSNLDELIHGTDVDVADTEGDGMPDGWEVDYGLDPLVHDADEDPDADGLSNREEFESDTQPLVADALPSEIDKDSMSLWLKPGNSVEASVGGLISVWNDQSGREHHARSVYNNRAASVSPDTVNGYDVVRFGPGNLRTPDLFQGGGDGFTLVFAILIPEQFEEGKYAFFGNSVWRQSGFRAILADGYPRLYSTQPGTSFSATAKARMVMGEPMVLSLTYRGPDQESALHVNGENHVRFAGEIPDNDLGLWLGKINGVPSQLFDMCEMLVFSEALDHKRRNAVESMLMARYQGTGPAILDGDDDGMSDWWELEFGPVDDGSADPDEDGLSNLEEFVFRSNPNEADSDGDGDNDYVEALAESNPWHNETVGIFDGDGDGLSDLVEMTLGTSPELQDTDADGMSDGWEVEVGLNPLVRDSAPDFDFDGVSNLDESLADSDPVEWIDSDEDGMHDRWETSHGLDLTTDDGRVDRDGDELSNLSEFLLGSDPNAVDSVPPLTLRVNGEGAWECVMRRSRSGTYWYDIELEFRSENSGWKPARIDLVETIDADTESVISRVGGIVSGLYRAAARR